MEHFISTVRQYPCLWNTAAIEYRDQELKDAAWAEVLNETDLSSVKEAKLRWKKLRDSYRDSLKREEAAGAGAGAGGGRRAPPWKHAQLMSFLAPHMGARKRPPDPSPPEPVYNHNGGGSDSSDTTDSPAAPPPARRRRPAPAAPSPPAPAADEPLAAFFGSMCMATRRLPLAAQLAVKRALFTAVMRAESAAAGVHYPPAPPPPPDASSSDSDSAAAPRNHNEGAH